MFPSELLHFILYEVETDGLGDQQDGGDSPGEQQYGGDSPGEQQYGGGGVRDQVETPGDQVELLGDQVELLGDQQYRDDSVSDQEDEAGQPEGDEETWTTSVSPLSVMEDQGECPSPLQPWHDVSGVRVPEVEGDPLGSSQPPILFLG